jgi:hypothetical protein
MNKAAFTLLYFILCFYCLGASLMEHFAVDRAWIYAGPTEFPVLHHESAQGVLAAYVIPLIVLTLFTVLMLWYRLPVISKKWVWVGLLCHGVTWISTALIQIPMQLQLDKAKDAALLEHLIATDWLRIIAQVLFSGVVSMMIYQVANAYGVSDDARRVRTGGAKCL